MRLAIGIVLLVAAAAAVAMAGAFGVLAALPLGLVAGFCLYPYVAGPVSGAIEGMVLPGHCGDLPEQFTRAKSLIAQHRYEEAASELEAMVSAKPELAAGWHLLAEIYCDHFAQPGRALELALKGLAAAQWQAEHEPLTLLAVDLHLERGERDAAVKLLEAQLRRATGTTSLNERLTHLRSAQE